MNYTKKQLQTLLDKQHKLKNDKSQINKNALDPLIVAREYQDEFVSLICACFAYGNVKAIVKFLTSLDFSLLDINKQGKSENKIKEVLSDKYYRFQNKDDIISFFIALYRLKIKYKHLKQNEVLRHIFYECYKINNNVLDGIDNLISEINKIYPYKSRGYKFLIGQNLQYTKNGDIKTKAVSAYKRWNLFLRWIVRKDSIDMGLWCDSGSNNKNNINKSDLLIPLDTHLFNVGKRLGLIERNTADLACVISLSEALKKFDKNDPIKYDFAIYRLGQEQNI
jgi:uncharacterized protein (TIGR02757 family)